MYHGNSTTESNLKKQYWLDLKGGSANAPSVPTPLIDLWLYKHINLARTTLIIWGHSELDSNVKRAVLLNFGWWHLRYTEYKASIDRWLNWPPLCSSVCASMGNSHLIRAIAHSVVLKWCNFLIIIIIILLGSWKTALPGWNFTNILFEVGVTNKQKCP